MTQLKTMITQFIDGDRNGMRIYRRTRDLH